MEESSMMTPIILSGVVFFAVVLIIVFLNAIRQAAVVPVAELTEEQAEHAEGNPLYAMVMPLCRGLGLMFRGNAFKNARANVQKKILAAGSPGGMTPDEYFGGILFGLLAGGSTGALLAISVNSYFVILIGGGMVLGAILPITYLDGKKAERHKLIGRMLPYWLDLMTLSVEAGLDFGGAMNRIHAKIGKTALGQELGLMMREMRLGMSRRDALRSMGNRVGLEDFNTVISAFVQADELGSSLGPVMRVQSETMRIKRMQKAEKMAQQAPVKMLGPLCLFIFPAVFIVLLAPIVMQMMK